MNDEEFTDFSIDIYGGNLNFATEAYRQDIESLVEDLKQEGFKNLYFHGEYSHEELGSLMNGIDWVIVTSVW